MFDALSLRATLQHPALWSTAVVLLSTWLVTLMRKQHSKSRFPRIIAKADSVRETIVEARNKYPNEPFYLETPATPEVIILPHGVYDELKSLPEDRVSFSKFTHQTMAARYTKVEVTHEVVDAIKIDLTRNINRVLSELQDEADHVFTQLTGSCPSWKALPLYSTILQVVAGLSSRTFVGLPLCRDPEWLTANITFTSDVLSAVREIKSWHPLLRPFVTPFMTTLRSLRAYRKFGAQKIRPQLVSLLTSLERGPDGKLSKAGFADETDCDNLSLSRWFLNHVDDISTVDPAVIGNWQMVVSFAATHTTSAALTNMLFDLASHPEYVPELRHEIEAVIAEEDFPDRRLRKTSMPKLKKMDSFMKESQRLAPPSAISITRKVTARQGLLLSTGHKIPWGSNIGFGFPYEPDSRVPQSTTVNAMSQPPLDEFAPFRYYNLRSVPGAESKHQFVTTNSDNIAFGAGGVACPGRFFASNEIKVVLVEILRRYDLALGPDGQGEGQGGFKRPASRAHGLDLGPDTEAVVYLRDR